MGTYRFNCEMTFVIDIEASTEDEAKSMLLNGDFDDKDESMHEFHLDAGSCREVTEE